MMKAVVIAALGSGVDLSVKANNGIQLATRKASFESLTLVVLDQLCPAACFEACSLLSSDSRQTETLHSTSPQVSQGLSIAV